MKKDEKIRVISPFDGHGNSYHTTLNYEKDMSRPAKMFKGHIITLKKENECNFEIKFLSTIGTFVSVYLSVEIDDGGHIGIRPDYYYLYDRLKQINKFSDFLGICLGECPLIKLDKEEYMPNITV
jgi:hypothetical protein